MDVDVAPFSPPPEDIDRDMPILSCEIEEVNSDEDRMSLELGDDEQGGSGPTDTEDPPTWPIFENISNGYFLENMEAPSDAETEVDGDEAEPDQNNHNGPSTSGAAVSGTSSSILAAHNGRIFNSRKLNADEKMVYALQGNPDFRYRKMYSNGQKAYKCWLCPTACNVFDKLVRHERRHGMTTKYPCTYCDYGALAPKLLDQHISYHKLQTNPEHMKNCYLKTTATSVNPYMRRRSTAKTKRSVARANAAAAANLPVTTKEEPMDTADLEGVDLGHDGDPMKSALQGNPKFVYTRLPCKENPSRTNYNFYCWICPSVFDRMDNLVRHSKLHGAGKRHQCDICNISYDFPSLLETHKQKHLMQKQGVNGNNTRPPGRSQRPGVSNRQVSKPQISKLQAALEEEQYGHAVRKKLISCAKCPARFFMTKDMENHMRLHGSGNQYVCRFCDYSSKQDFLLTRHEELHTKMSRFQSRPIQSEAAQASDTSMGDGDNKKLALQCTKCPAIINSQRDYESHLGLHGSLKKFKCSACDYAVSRQDYLQKHELVHQLVQPRQHTSLSPARVSSPVHLNISKRQSEILPKIARNSLAAKMVSPEEYYKIRAGNPDFYYKPCVRISHGRRQECTTFKCMSCPSAYLEFKHYLDHVQLHGASNEFTCLECDYSVNGEQRYYKHMEFHQLNNQHRPQQRRAPGKSLLLSSVVKQEQVSRPARPSAPPPVVTVTRRPIKIEPLDDDVQIVKRMRPNELKREKPAIPVVDVMDESEPPAIAVPLVCMSSSKPPPLRRGTKSIAEAYIIDTEMALESKSHDFLVHYVTVRNFMCIDEFDAPVRSNVWGFPQTDGKGAIVLAMLVGIGYDILLENYVPASICGVPLKDLVRHGYDTSTIELTLSLHSSNELEEQYGSHLKLTRTLHRGLPLTSCSFEISSADMNDLYPRNSVAIGKPRLRSILEKLHITPLLFRLLVLDNVNINYVMNETDNWHHYYQSIVESNIKSVKVRLDKLMLKFNRLKDDLQWRNLRYSFLMSQLSTEYPIEDQTFREWRKIDVIDHSKMEKELAELYERHVELEGVIGCYTSEINDLPKVLLGRMKHRYQEFLHRQDYLGSVLIDEETKGLAIWIQDRVGPGNAPDTVEEALSMWKETAPKAKHFAVIGLFLAYWEIINTLPLFAVDANSADSAKDALSFPEEGVEVLYEVMMKKGRDGHQFVATLPKDSKGRW